MNEDRSTDWEDFHLVIGEGKKSTRQLDQMIKTYFELRNNLPAMRWANDEKQEQNGDLLDMHTSEHY